MQPEAYEWPDVPKDLQTHIIKHMGDDWDASEKHGGPFVVVFPFQDSKLPFAVSRRLDKTHDAWVTLVYKDQILTVWYDEVGITL